MTLVLLLVLGRVRFLLWDKHIYAWWEQGGAVTYQRNIRPAVLSVLHRGWRRGVWRRTVYAPISAAGRRERATLRQDVSCLVEAAPPSTMVAGQLRRGDANQGCSGGTFRPCTTDYGWGRMADMTRDAGSRFQQRPRCTWRHPRLCTDHELDHFLIHQGDLWHLHSCRILYDGPDVQVSRTLYTDHTPVECLLGCASTLGPSVRAPASLRRNCALWQAMVESRHRDLRLELEPSIKYQSHVGYPLSFVKSVVATRKKESGYRYLLVVHAQASRPFPNGVTAARWRELACGRKGPGLLWKRSSPMWWQRTRTMKLLLLAGLLEWIQPAGKVGSYSLRLAGGEPSRLLFEEGRTSH